MWPSVCEQGMVWPSGDLKPATALSPLRLSPPEWNLLEKGALSGWGRGFHLSHQLALATFKSQQISMELELISLIFFSEVPETLSLHATEIIIFVPL